MSANLDLVRSIYADWERGDFSRAEWADPEIGWEFVGGPEHSSGTGVPALAAAVRSWIGAWDDFRTEGEEYRELYDERVLVFHRVSARGKTSGIKVETIGSRAATLFHVTNGSVTKPVLYADRDRALADLGLAAEGL
jgi:ketosteroid isomerase-like protein